MTVLNGSQMHWTQEMETLFVNEVHKVLRPSMSSK